MHPGSRNAECVVECQFPFLVHRGNTILEDIIGVLAPAVNAVHRAGGIGPLSPVRDRVGDLVSHRVHPLTAVVAMCMFLVQPIQGFVGTTSAWHRFAAWLTR